MQSKQGSFCLEAAFLNSEGTKQKHLQSSSNFTRPLHWPCSHNLYRVFVLSCQSAAPVLPWITTLIAAWLTLTALRLQLDPDISRSKINEVIRLSVLNPVRPVAVQLRPRPGYGQTTDNSLTSGCFDLLRLCWINSSSHTEKQLKHGEKELELACLVIPWVSWRGGSGDLEVQCCF